MDKKEFVTKVDETGKEINKFIEEKAEKHNFTKAQVIVGIIIAVFALIGISQLAL